MRLDVVVDDIWFAPPCRVGTDVTIVSPHNAMYSSAASAQAGGEATRAEVLKIPTYAPLCEIKHIELVPMVFDVHGGADESAKGMLRQIAEVVSQKRWSNPITEYQR